MELIDREELLKDLKTSAIYHANNSREETLMYRDRNIVREQPTVVAIPREQIDAMIKDIDKIQVYLDCHEGFADEYISKTKLMRIVDKYCGRENNGETNNTK